MRVHPCCPALPGNRTATAVCQPANMPLGGSPQGGPAPLVLSRDSAWLSIRGDRSCECIRVARLCRATAPRQQCVSRPTCLWGVPHKGGLPPLCFLAISPGYRFETIDHASALALPGSAGQPHRDSSVSAGQHASGGFPTRGACPPCAFSRYRLAIDSRRSIMRVHSRCPALP